MHRVFLIGIGVAVLLMSSSVQAAEPQQVAPTSTASSADLQRMAEDSCHAALDNERFEWNTMEECVTATAAKLKRSQQQHASAGH